MSASWRERVFHLCSAGKKSLLSVITSTDFKQYYVQAILLPRWNMQATRLSVHNLKVIVQLNLQVVNTSVTLSLEAVRKVLLSLKKNILEASLN